MHKPCRIYLLPFLLLTSVYLTMCFSPTNPEENSNTNHEENSKDFVEAGVLLVSSETNIQGNLFLRDVGIGWTADGNGVIHTIGYYGAEDLTIRYINIDSKAVNTIRNGIYDVRNLKTSPNWEHIAYIGDPSGFYDDYRLYLADAPDYSDQIELDNVTGNATEYFWSPDSRLILWYWPFSDTQAVLDVVSQQRTHTLYNIGKSLAFSPDGTHLLVAESTEDSLHLSSFDLNQQQLSIIATIPEADVLHAVWNSTDIKIIIEAGDYIDSSIQVFSVADGSYTTLLHNGISERWRLAAVAPDGESAAFWFGESVWTGLFEGYTRDHLYIVDLLTGERRLLADSENPRDGGTVAFSPDGTRLAYYYKPVQKTYMGREYNSFNLYYKDL